MGSAFEVTDSGEIGSHILRAETSTRIETDAQAAGKLFEERCPEAEVAILSGGQPVYYYLISAE